MAVSSLPAFFDRRSRDDPKQRLYRVARKKMICMTNIPLLALSAISATDAAQLAKRVDFG
jgi:hypothetical protein